MFMLHSYLIKQTRKYFSITLIVVTRMLRISFVSNDSRVLNFEARVWYVWFMMAFTFICTSSGETPLAVGGTEVTA